MAELGLIAAVVQVADLGIRLSHKLYKFGHTVASADESILVISKDISNTCSILKTLGQSLEKDRQAQLYSENAINTADTIVKECLGIFHEMDVALVKKIRRIGLDGSASRPAVVALEKLKWPFLRPKMMLLWSNLDKLKSSLHLMLNVFIYTRLVLERAKPPSVMNDQRAMIEHLLQAIAEQSREFESSEALMIGNGHNGDLEHSSEAATQRMCSLDATTGIAKYPIRSPSARRTIARGADPATMTVGHYCNLIKCFMQEIEADDHDTGQKMRCRMKEDIIRMHRREARMLRAAYGHGELRDMMCGKLWRLADMDDESDGARDASATARAGSGSLPAATHDWNHNLNPSVRLQDLGPHENVLEDPLSEVIASRRRNAGSDSTSQNRVFKANPMMQRFLEERNDPWNLEQSVYELLQSDNPTTLYESPWVPLQKFVVATKLSDEEETTTSFPDLPALTDSFDDTGTFVSARSVIEECAFESSSPCLVEGDRDEPLVVLSDEGMMISLER